MRKNILHIGLMGITLGLLGLLFMGAKPALAANPTAINFQGKVVNANGTNVSDGTYSFVFRIYNTSSPTPATACGSDSACLFEETQGSVSVTNGTFQVELGSTCTGGLVGSNSCTKSVAGGLNFASNNALYLTLQFSGDTSGTHGGFMWPVIHLTSVPYAYYADNAGALNGLSSGNFVQLAQGLQTDSSTSNASIAINKTGATANIVTLQSGGTGVFGIDNGGALSVTPLGNNIGTIIRQTTGTATSGNIFDIQGANTTSHFIQVTETAANQGSISITSLGSNGLTLQSGSGTVTLGSSTILTSTAGLQIASGSGNLTLNAAGGTITLGSNTTAVLFSNAGTAAFDATSGQELDLGTNGTAHTTKLGDTATTSTTTLQSGAGGINLLPDGGSNTGIVAKPTNNSTKAFQVQNAAGTLSYLGVDTSGGQVLLGTVGSSGVNGKLVFNTTDASNTTISLIVASTATSYSLTLPTAAAAASNQCLVSSSGTSATLSFMPCGAGSTSSVTLTPEYAGAVLTGDGGSNSGTMTSDFCSGSSLRNIPSASNPCGASEEHNYYTWVTTSQNDYDIWIRWQIPSDFSDFAASNAIQMFGWRTDSTATTNVDLSLYNSSGTLCGTTTHIATGTAAWTQTSLSGAITASACSITAGNVVDLRIQMVANNKTVRAGEITINYNRN